MDDKFRYAWKQLKTLPKSVEKNVFTKGFPSGSSCYGGFIKGKSDIDILLYKEKASRFFKWLVENDFGFYQEDQYEEGSGFLSIYVKVAGKSHPINLLLFDNKERYYIWEKATEILHEMYLTEDAMILSILEDKSTRIKLFEKMQDLVEELNYGEIINKYMADNDNETKIDDDPFKKEF